MATGIVHVYANFILNALEKEIKWAAASPDTFKCTLHTSSYTPNYGTHDYQDDLTNELTTAGGYTVGGNTLTSVSAALVAADSLTARADSTAYVVGNVRRPATGNGHVYICVVAGTSGGTPPTWPTDPGHSVDDGTVTWLEAGSHVLKLTGTIPAWNPATFTCRYGVIADTTPGSAATNPLVCCIDFQTDQSPSAAAFTITLDGDGAVVIPIRAIFS